jgi:hypothetical protein
VDEVYQQLGPDRSGARDSEVGLECHTIR